MAMLGRSAFTISIASRATVESRARAGDGKFDLCMSQEQVSHESLEGLSGCRTHLELLKNGLKVASTVWDRKQGSEVTTANSLS